MVIVREFTDTDALQASVIYFESFKSYLKERMEISAPQPAGYWLDNMRHTVNSDYENISFVAEIDNKLVDLLGIGLNGNAARNTLTHNATYIKTGLSQAGFIFCKNFLKCAEKVPLFTVVIY